MAIQFLINDVDYTCGIGIDGNPAYEVDLESVSIAENITTNNGTADFNVIIRPGAVGLRTPSRPKGMQEVVIKNGDDIEFAGVISKVQELVPTAADEMIYSVEAQDYRPWFDKRVWTNSYTNTPIEDIVINIVQCCVNLPFANLPSKQFTALKRVNDGSINENGYIYNTGITLATKKFDHMAPSQAIQALADYVGFWFYIDYNKNVHFEPISTNESPLVYNENTKDNILLVDTDTSNYSDLTFSEDVSQIRNQVYFYGHKLPQGAKITDGFAGDGQTQSFNLTCEPKHSIDIADLIINVGGVTQTNKLDIIDATPGSGTPGCAYVHYKNQTVRFATPPGNVTVSVSYYPMLPTQNMYNDSASFTTMKDRDGLDGIYEWGTSNTKLSSINSSVVNLAGQGMLLKYALPHYTGSFNSFTTRWKPGQYFYLTSSMRMDGEFKHKEFYVLKITKTIVNHPQDGTPQFYYQISIADSAYNY